MHKAVTITFTLNMSIKPSQSVINRRHLSLSLLINNKSSVAHDKWLIKVIGRYYRPTVSGDKNPSFVREKVANFSRLTKTGQQKIFKRVWKHKISAEISHCDWSVVSVWNIQAGEGRGDDQIDWSIWSKLISLWSRWSELSELSFAN